MSLRKLSERLLEDDDSESSDQNGDLSESDSPEIYIDPEVSEPLDGSLTNKLVKTQVGTVLKEFSEKPVMSYVQAAGRIPAAALQRQDKKDRIENERKFREFISDYDIETPDALDVSEPYVEFERLDGEDLNDYINENPEEAEQYGREVANFLNYVHGNSGAITDLRLNNFMVQESDELAFLDAEYFVDGARGWEREMDLITLENSLRQVSSEVYSSFRSGFDERYDGQIRKRDEVMASPLSLCHSVLELDYQRFSNAAKNLKR